MDKWLKSTNAVRVIALLLAILLWAIVHLEKQSAPDTISALIPEQKISNVSISVTNLDKSNYYVKSIEPRNVEINLRGRRANLDKVNTANYRIAADLSNITTGTHRVNLRAINFPSGVKVDIYPSSVLVNIESMEKMEFPVDIQLLGELKSGYKAGLPVVKPSRVHVTAPSSVMPEVAKISAEVDVAGAEDAVTKKVKLTAYDKSGKEVDVGISPQVIDVEVPITKPVKTLPLQIKLIGQTPAGYSVDSFIQSVDQVTVYGSQKLLDQMEFYDGIQVDLSNVRTNQHYTLDLPKPKGIDKVDPATVEIDVKIVPSSQKTLNQIPITIVGMNDQFVTKITDPAGGKFNMDVEAAPSLLNKLRNEDVQAIVDVSNLPPGTHKLTVSYNLPIFVKQSGKKPEITVEITAKDSGAKSQIDQVEPDNTPVIQDEPQENTIEQNTTP